MKIKIKVKTSEGAKKIIINPKGDWIDLYMQKDITLTAPTITSKVIETKKSKKIVTFENKMLDLGVAIELPKGYEAWVLPRSSTPKLGIELRNSMGIIDNSYCGNDDIWKFSARCMVDGNIENNTRIAQFRIMLSQKATVWQKIKWLFSNGIKIVYVDSLNSKNRGGFGSTGKK